MTCQNISVGIDIEDIERFKTLRRNDSFITDNFSEEEINYCFSHTLPEIHLAGLFCAKEAFVKATGRRTSLKNIVVVHERGKPFVKGMEDKVDISISHTTSSAVAVAIARCCQQDERHRPFN